MNEKSILEQALLQVQTLEEAVKVNAKGILASTMKQELNDLLKESMEEEEEETPVADDEVAMDEQPKPDEEEDDMSDPDADAEGEENDDETSISDEPSDDEEDELEMPADDESDMDADDLTSMDDDSSMDSDDDMLDMTDASDEEVLKVFKAMSDEDGIVVKKDGNMIDFKDGEDEYIIKLDQDETPAPDFGDQEMAEDWNAAGAKPEEDELAEEDETVYEIDLDGDDEEEMPAKEVEATEAARTQANDVRGEGPRQGMKYKAGRHEMNEEVTNLKKQNAEYKKALILFKDKLNEVAVFNANLAYATRLFTENSTTKNEKLNILKRFDSISTITESKNLYTSIKTELDTKKPVTESVSDKITSTPSSSSSDVLSESKVYEAPQFTRMRDLMKKIK
jgi:hypothetical protein